MCVCMCCVCVVCVCVVCVGYVCMCCVCGGVCVCVCMVFITSIAALVENTILCMHGGLSPDLKDLNKVWYRIHGASFSSSYTT